MTDAGEHPPQLKVESRENADEHTDENDPHEQLKDEKIEDGDFPTQEQIQNDEKAVRTDDGGDLPREETQNEQSVDDVVQCIEGVGAAPKLTEVDSQGVENTLDDSGDDDEDSSEWETQEDESGGEDNHAETAEELFKKLAAENRLAHRTIDENDLPTTVSVLDGKNGAKVYLVGTAHFSKESCEDVRKVISRAQPDVVMIELCRSRTDLLVNDEEMLTKLAGDMSLDKIVKQVRHKGVVSGLMTFLLLHMSAHITKQLGMAPGGEFRAAYQESRRVPGCKLLFGDRAVEITLQRAFSTFSIWQKLKFAFCILKDLGPIKPEDIEKLKEKDMLEQALGEMMGEFPEMTSVFLAERDIYLAHSLQAAASSSVQTETEATPATVVGVVGLGHVAGIKKNFHRDISSKEMRDLLKVPRPSRIRTVMKTFIKISLVACLGYGMYRFTYWTGFFHGVRSLYIWSGLGQHLPAWGEAGWRADSKV